MRSILLLIFTTILIVNCRSEECKESYFNPVTKIDIQRLSGRWNTYMRYKNVFQENDTCAYCEITYKLCEEKYQLVSRNFVNDVAAPARSAWVEVTGSEGIFNLDWNGVGIPKIFVTYVDYDKLALLRACYKGQHIVMLVIRGTNPDKDVKKKIKQLIKNRDLNKNQLQEMNFECATSPGD